MLPGLTLPAGYETWMAERSLDLSAPSAQYCSGTPSMTAGIGPHMKLLALMFMAL